MRISSKDTRKISQELGRRLSLYASVAGAAGVSLLALARPTEAEVVYTPVHQIIGPNQAFVIDFAHDGTVDFTLRNFLSYDRSYRKGSLNVLPNGIDGVVTSGLQFVAPLAKGAPVGPQRPFRGATRIMAQRIEVPGAGTYTFGNWFNVVDTYIGLQFQIHGNFHYGWARLSVESVGHFKLVAVLTGYAYETEANKPLLAGYTDSASEEEEEEAAANSQPISGPSHATLAALSLGAPGLSIWRRDQLVGEQVLNRNQAPATANSEVGNERCKNPFETARVF